jgi:hypothetical protein
MPLEKAIVERVMCAAKRLGWMPLKMHGNAYVMKGLPDVLVLKSGKAAWMEVKRPGHEPTRIQTHRMRELIAAGCPCAVVHSVGDAQEFLEALP